MIATNSFILLLFYYFTILLFVYYFFIFDLHKQYIYTFKNILIKVFKIVTQD